MISENKCQHVGECEPGAALIRPNLTTVGMCDVLSSFTIEVRHKRLRGIGNKN